MEEQNTQMTQAETLAQMMAADMEERKKALYRHKMPAQNTLKDMLTAMTKAELDDIRFNLNVSGTSSLKKAELVERLVPEVLNFARLWLPSILLEEYECFQHFLINKGQSTELRDDDVRLDYLRGLGMISCAKDGDKLVWYMPEEIRDEFKKINSPTFEALATMNTEITRLAAGALFFYGYMDYEALYTLVAGHLETNQREDLSFKDFVGVMLNASCWTNTIVALPQGVKYYTLIDEDALEREQLKHSNLDFAPFTYTQLFEAGTENHIDDTNAYKALAQFFMTAHDCDVLKAADIVGEIYILLQNGGSMQEAAEYLEQLGMMKEDAKAQAVVPLLIAFNNETHLWSLKGHTPSELFAKSGMGQVIPFEEVRRQKVGRNDPCPCGSGKKYKNCCLSKDEN